MKAQELRDKSLVELSQLKEKSARELMDASFAESVGQLKDKSKLGKLRKDIARINTIIREKQ